MTTTAIFTDLELKKFAADWYKLLDVHAPVDDYKAFLSQDGDLEMIFPEGKSEGLEGFESWYERVTHLFFDEEHTVRAVQSLGTEGDLYKLKVVVNWQASQWKAPAPKSERIKADAYQTWLLKRSVNGKPLIAKYIVDELRYNPGSASL